MLLGVVCFAGWSRLICCCIVMPAGCPALGLLMLQPDRDHTSVGSSARFDSKHKIYCSTVDLQVASVTGSLQRELGGAVQTGLQSALPQQLAGPALQQALELALGSHLQAALQAPLQTAFRSSFEQRLIPAFEGACQSMFSQASRRPTVLSAACMRVVRALASKHLSSDVQLLTSRPVAMFDKLLVDCNVALHACNATKALIGPPLLQQVQATFAGGLSDHLQAAGGANAAVAASLQESLAAATSLAETLRDEVAEGQRKLVALAEEDRGDCLLPGPLYTMTLKSLCELA